VTEPATSTHATIERAAAGPAPSLNVPATPRQPWLAGAFSFRGSLSRSAGLSISVATSILLLGSWEVADRLGWFDPTFLPPPSDVATTIWNMAASGELIENALISTARVWAAFLLSAVMAIPIGMLMSTYRPIRAALEPVVDFIRYLPVPALVPLSIIWFGVGEETKIFLLWLGTFFQLVLLVAEDMNRVPHEYVEIGYTLGARSPQVLAHIAFRSMLPSLMDNLRIALGWCWTYLIIAEIVAASSGLGYVIWTARRYMQTSEVMAGVVTIGVIGLVTDQLLRALNRRLFRYL
jgi:NitT/TauT family transport system permease protein